MDEKSDLLFRAQHDLLPNFSGQPLASTWWEDLPGRPFGSVWCSTGHFLGMNRDLHKEAFGFGQILSKHYFYLHTYLNFGRGEQAGRRAWQGQGSTLDIEPPHTSRFSFQWCQKTHMAPGSGPHQDWLLLMAVCHLTKALLLPSRHFYLSRSKTCWRFADGGWQLLTGCQAPRWKVWCQQFWEQVTCQGLKLAEILSPGTNPFQLSLLQYKTWERGCGGSPSYTVQQQATEMETQFFSFLVQAVNVFGHSFGHQATLHDI